MGEDGQYGIGMPSRECEGGGCNGEGDDIPGREIWVNTGCILGGGKGVGKGNTICGEVTRVARSFGSPGSSNGS